MDRFVPFAVARAAVLDLALTPAAERVALVDAAGRTLAIQVAAPEPMPPFDTSAMDGFGVHADDLARLPGRLRVGGTVHAGQAEAPSVSPGVAVAVMTGAILPPGAAAVVPVEWTTRDGDAVELDRTIEPGKHIRRAGEAVAAGTVVLAAGTIVRPGGVALLASVGAAEVAVARRPRVAVVATGDELVEASQTPGPGQIRNSNGPGLAAQVRAAGGAVVGPLVARDTAASVVAALDADADLFVFAGGVSMGERDLVRIELERRGVTWAFWQVRQRPGKPLAAGRLPDGRPVVALPGNPVSAAVCFEVYVRPLLAASLGRSRVLSPTVPATLAVAIPKAPGLHTLARVTALPDNLPRPSGAEGRLVVTPAGAQGSHAVPSLAHADGLAHLPADWDEAPAGSVVAFERWGWS